MDNLLYFDNTHMLALLNFCTLQVRQFETSSVCCDSHLGSDSVAYYQLKDS
jgi:hypothetical protein